MNNRCLWWLWGLLGCLFWQEAAAQLPESKPIAVDKPRQGVFLVAGRAMPDPRFAKTVILLLEHDTDGSLGLIVNRPTGIALHEALPDLTDTAQPPHQLYAGGPVAMQALLLLVRDVPPKDSLKHIFADVYWSLDQQALSKFIEQNHNADTLRVYSGHAGWAPGQLDSELIAGGWRLFEADPNLVFHSEPDGLWDWFMETPQQILVQPQRTLDLAAPLAYNTSRKW
jgi:putative transcriptional regulator